MKKKEIIGLYNALSELGSSTGQKFVYALVKNLSIIKPDVEAILKTINTDKYKEFEAKRFELAKNHSKTDENGKPIILNNGKNFDIKDYEKFENDFLKLNEDYKKVLDEREKFLESKADKIDFYKINPDDLPQDITFAQLNGISVLLADKIKKA